MQTVKRRLDKHTKDSQSDELQLTFDLLGDYY